MKKKTTTSKKTKKEYCCALCSYEASSMRAVGKHLEVKHDIWIVPTPEPTEWASNCCTAPVRVSVSDEGTGCYICNKCNKACDRQPPTEEIASLGAVNLQPVEEKCSKTCLHVYDCPRCIKLPDLRTPPQQRERCIEKFCKPNCKDCKKEHDLGVCSCEPLDKGMDWEKEFDERFNDNFVYWQELAAEIRIGDPDFKSVKQFIRKTIAQELAHTREDVLKEVVGVLEGLKENNKNDYTEKKRDVPAFWRGFDAGLNEAISQLSGREK